MAVYFASDFHLGMPTNIPQKERERIIVSWFDLIKMDASEIYILGDLFDYWFEYKHVVPKGHTRILGKLAECVDSGIAVHLFTGNHDMWMFEYLTNELGVMIHRDPIKVKVQGKDLFLGHGDGLGPADHGYKFIKKVFRSKLNQWLFARLHPNFGIGLMKFFSNKSRESEREIIPFSNPEKEWLVQYAEKKLTEDSYDYFLFGHRHLPIEHTLSNNRSIYINTGDWFNHYTYAKMVNGSIKLLKFNPKQ